MKTIKVDFKDLSKLANQPVLKHCRDLIVSGEDPKTRLEAYRGDTLCLSISEIGLGAKVEVQEDKNVGPRFIRYRDRSERLPKAHPCV